MTDTNLEAAAQVLRAAGYSVQVGEREWEQIQFLREHK